ncbi:T9SS type A sorting domain-containing protein [Saccharicrinis sp. FJH62]|uniref:T9SS type A sorting domain-containing protein n=1 Tax=Saccharicrinis sp. FJH62 TaxID=3344657 RepID=UPI0035D48928
MKPLILPLVFCLFSGLITAQNERIPLMKPVRKSVKSSGIDRVDQRSFSDQYAKQNSWTDAKTHKLDSVYTETIYETDDPFFETTTEREIYEYDSFGNVLKEMHHFWNGEEWKPRLEYIMTYNSAGWNLSELIRDWDENEEKWVETAKTERTYDDDNRLISIVEYEEDGDVLEPYCRTEYFYENESIYPVYEIDYDWSGSWDENSKTESTWDDKGNLTEEIRYDFQSSDGTWIKDSKWVYEYDDNGNWIRETDYDWYDEWIFNWKCENSYDSNNQRIQYNSFGWNDEDSIWYNSYQYLYAFNENGNMTSVLSAHWSHESEQFVPYDKNEYVYDSNYNMLSHSYSEYEKSTGTWLVLLRSEYESTAGISFLNIALPFETEFEFSGKFESAPQTETNYIDEEGNFEPYTKLNYYYSELGSTGLHSVNEPDIIVCPNPASDIIRIILPEDFHVLTVRIMDLHGQYVKLLNPEILNRIDLPGLEAGYYLIELITNEANYFCKFIKE